MSKNKLVGVHGGDFECTIKWDGIGDPDITIFHGNFIGDGVSNTVVVALEGVANLLLDYAAKERDKKSSVA